LEALAGQLACRRMSMEEIEILGELHDDLSTYFEKGDRLSYLEVNRLIHEYIVEASKSPSLILAWRLLLPRAERARKLTTLDHDRWAEAFAEHNEIYKAVSKRDEERLNLLMKQHFINGADSLKRDEAKDRARARSNRYAQLGRS
jgi:DNA-binding GntR family transcriptional regulator